MAAHDERNSRDIEPSRTGGEAKDDAREPAAQKARAGESRASAATPAAASSAATAPSRRKAIIMVAAICLPLLLLVGVLFAARSVYSNNSAQNDELSAVGVPSPDAERPECEQLIAALPDELGKAKRVQLRDPIPQATAGYRLADGSPVVVRCGLPAPESFVVGSALQEVNKVQWFTEDDPVEQVTDTTYVTVDRPVHIAITFPEKDGSGALQELSDLIADKIAAVKPKPAPAR